LEPLGQNRNPLRLHPCPPPLLRNQKPTCRFVIIPSNPFGLVVSPLVALQAMLREHNRRVRRAQLGLA
jgi:hypothetical protein